MAYTLSSNLSIQFLSTLKNCQICFSTSGLNRVFLRFQTPFFSWSTKSVCSLSNFPYHWTLNLYIWKNDLKILMLSMQVLSLPNTLCNVLILYSIALAPVTKVGLACFLAYRQNWSSPNTFCDFDMSAQIIKSKGEFNFWQYDLFVYIGDGSPPSNLNTPCPHECASGSSIFYS